MRTGIRFRPPRVELSREADWALQRAFGPASGPEEARAGIDPAQALELAQALGIAERIGSRTAAPQLETELGSEVAGRLRDMTAAAAAVSLLVEQVGREVAAAAAGLEVPVVFLKGAALQLAGSLGPGSRTMCDVDVLASADGARNLQAALRASGCMALEVPESDHQLQFLTHPSGFGIELHHRIPGLRLAGGLSATAGQLFDAKRCWRAPGMPPGCFIPDDQVLLAHLLVHGIAQHGMAPAAYPMARMLADLQDLGTDGAAWRRFMAAGMRWIENDVSRAEVEAVRGLVDRLGRGEPPAALAAGGDPAASLLRHLVAGAVDARYREALKFRGLVAKPRDVGWLRGLATTLRGAVFPTRAQLDILFGKPQSELGYWGLRVWRPFDLVGRAWRYGRAWLQLRLRAR